MDLQSGKLFWQTTFENAPSYPALEEDISCDVLIIGGGSSGAQCAYYMANTGLDIVVVDKRKIGTGSTSANTALIQYAGEKMFYQLINSFGEEYATRHLKLCEQAINDIEASSQASPINPNFTRRDTLYYASYEEDVETLKKEYELLKKHGFPVELWDEKKISEHYPFSKRMAIYGRNDGEVNPYKFNHGVLALAHQQGVRVFEETEINGKILDEKEATFFTTTKHSIKAKKVIFAGGYENLEFKAEKNAVLTSSYAVVTNPIDDFSAWHKRTLIWETARPYIYMRTTEDNRVIIGGFDETTSIAAERDGMLLNKRDRLIKEFHKLFPNIEASPEFYLSAFYGGTHDGLPLIGVYDDMPNCYLLMAYGDNGMVYSMVLANILKDVIVHGESKDLDLYLQTRPKVK